MTEPLLQAQHLSCHRGNRALINNLSFTISPGDLLQIVGNNGSGKTTLLRALTGLFPLHSGELLWRGKALSQHRLAYQQQLYYLGHQIAVKKDLTVAEHLMLSWRHCYRGDDNDAILRSVNLSDYRDQLCGQLSQGQKQRVALAMLLASSASLWILDEPFAALDQVSTKQLQQLFAKHLQKNGTIVFTSHQALPLSDLTPATLNLSGING